MHKLLRNTVHTTLHWWKKSIFCATQHWNHLATQTWNITFFTALDVTLVAIHMLCDDIQYVHIYKNFIWISVMTTAVSREGLIICHINKYLIHKKDLHLNITFCACITLSLPRKITSIILTFSAPFLLCIYPFHT